MDRRTGSGHLPPALPPVFVDTCKREAGAMFGTACPVELAAPGAGRARKRFGITFSVRRRACQICDRGGWPRIRCPAREECTDRCLRGPAVHTQLRTAPDCSLVLVRGRLQIWDRGGRFQITACGRLLPTDLTGARAERRKAAERRLRTDGVLDRPSRPLPRFPAKIAVVTSADSAAMRDVRATIGRRAPWVGISLHSCVVQGRSAAASIVAALDSADVSGADLILLTRGGGAPDAFDPFDDPAVVRRVARSQLPIIVAVGHEGDSTLADRAADHAASTPTAAAEAAVPDGQVIRREVLEHCRRLHAAAHAVCSAARVRCNHVREATQRAGRNRIRLEREKVQRVAPHSLSATLVQLSGLIGNVSMLLAPAFVGSPPFWYVNNGAAHPLWRPI